MSENNGKTVFRSAMRGYNKEDVNRYIYGENRRFESLEKSYVATIDSLKSDLESARSTVSELLAEAEKLSALTEELEAARSRITTLEGDIAAGNGLLAEAKEKILSLEASADSSADSHKLAVSDYESIIENLRADTESARAEAAAALSEKNSALAKATESEEALSTLREQITDLRALLDERDSEVGILRGEIEGLKQTAARMADRPYTSPRDTAVNDSYVEAEAAAKELLRRAKEAAEDMLRRAEISSDRLLERAQNRAVACRADMITTARELISSVSAEVRRSVDECTADFVRGVRSVYRESGVSVTDSTFNRYEDEFSNKIARMQADLDRTIEEKLSEFDRRHGDYN